MGPWPWVTVIAGIVGGTLLGVMGRITISSEDVHLIITTGCTFAAFRVGLAMPQQKLFTPQNNPRGTGA